MDRSDLYSSLLKARRARGITQAQLGKLLNLPQSYISQMEKGKHDIKTETLLNWARILDFELMLIPRQAIPAVSYLTASTKSGEIEIPAAYGPLPEDG